MMRVYDQIKQLVTRKYERSEHKGTYLIPQRPAMNEHRSRRKRRPLIGVPTWSDQSQAYADVTVCAMNQLYLRAIEQAGGLPILIPLHLDSEGLDIIFEQLDGLFLAGGEDIALPWATHANQFIDDDFTQNTRSTFDRDQTELMLTRWAIAEGVPILGICRGMQLINVASGGTLYQDLGDERPDLCKHNFFGPEFARDRVSHGIEIAQGTSLHDLFGGSTVVNSLHHQGVDQVGQELKVVAWSENGLPEAIQSASSDLMLGVQWHPEALIQADPRQGSIFRDFVEMASMN